jgi:glycosyltransferase involved in cell wall biosynthesis
VRIGLISPCWVPTPPPAYGGTEQVVDLLARGLTAAGHDVVLFATGDSTCPVPRKWAHDRPPSPMGDVVGEAFHTVRAYDELARCGVELIHDHTTLGPLLAASGVGDDVPLVATNHGPFNSITNGLYAAAAARAHVVAISHDQARSAAPLVPIAAVIPHGIEVDAMPFGAGDGGYVLFLGRMVAEKGVREAIEVARHAGWPIKLAAKCREEREREYFEHEIAPLLGEDAEYVGEVGLEDKTELLAGAAALINPIQWREPFGLVMAESLACGTPVIATSIGSAPELIDSGITGWVCDDVDEMAMALKCIDQIDRRACRDTAERRFSIATMVDAHVDLYRSII